MTGEARLGVRREGAVTIIGMQRAEKLNAIDAAMSWALQDAFDAFEADDGARVAVLHGIPRAFSVGADLQELAERGTGPLPPRGFAGLCADPPGKPLVAAIDGYALGGGLEVALACDVLVLGDNAVLGLPEVTHGLAALAGGVERLQDRLPPSVAARMVLTGARMDAAAAVAWGLGVPASGRALPAALALAHDIAAHPVAGLRESVRLLRRRDPFSGTSAAQVEERLAALVAARTGIAATDVAPSG